MDKSCCSTKIPPLRTDNNEYACTNEEKSEVLNNIFCTVSTIDDANYTRTSSPEPIILGRILIYYSLK